MLSLDTCELSGKQLVILDYDSAFAAQMAGELRLLGARVLGPAPTLFYAMQLIGHRDRRNIDAAILEVQPQNETVYDMADTLRQRGVPVLFTSSFEPHAFPQRFSNVPLLRKPMDGGKLVAQLCSLMRSPPVAVAELLPQVPASHQPPASHFARALLRSWLR
jgi:hypothetical protein